MTREGITVDPDRLTALRNVSPPRNLGDVWQFNAAAGWIRRDNPLYSESSSILTDIVTRGLRHAKGRKNLAAARRVSLESAGWGAQHQRAWENIRKGLLETITSSYRDRRKRVCLFSDASASGWTYAITQCDQEELDKPWAEQHHEILTVHSGKFSDTQLNWDMSSKEAYPIRKAAETERTLLLGDRPWVSINDHRSLTFVFDSPAREATVSTAANGRLNRWATFLRCCNFDTLHIPGHENHFCDLLSRQGCVTATARWRHTSYKSKRLDRHARATNPVTAAAPVRAIVAPRCCQYEGSRPLRGRPPTQGPSMRLAGSRGTCGGSSPSPSRHRPNGSS